MDLHHDRLTDDKHHDSSDSELLPICPSTPSRQFMQCNFANLDDLHDEDQPLLYKANSVQSNKSNKENNHAQQATFRSRSNSNSNTNGELEITDCAHPDKAKVQLLSSAEKTLKTPETSKTLRAAKTVHSEFTATPARPAAPASSSITSTFSSPARACNLSVFSSPVNYEQFSYPPLSAYFADLEYSPKPLCFDSPPLTFIGVSPSALTTSFASPSTLYQPYLNPRNFNFGAASTAIMDDVSVMQHAQHMHAHNNENLSSSHYHNDQHPHKRRKLNPSEYDGAMSSGMDSENEPILKLKTTETSNVSKRELFKEKLSNIDIENNNINSNQHMHIGPETAPNAFGHDGHASQCHDQAHHEHATNQNNNSAPVLTTNHITSDHMQGQNDAANLSEWYHDSSFEMPMFAMGMDEMKDVGLNGMDLPFMNQMGMVDMHGNTNQPQLQHHDHNHNHNHSHSHHNPGHNLNHNHQQHPHQLNLAHHPVVVVNDAHSVKQENDIPPNLGGAAYNNSGMLCISTSPQQQSPMFMDTTNGYSIYASDYNMQTHGALGAASLLSGPNVTRPSHIPILRARNTTRSHSNNHNHTQNNSNSSESSNASTASSSSSSASSSASSASQQQQHHVLTPFDYPLSNPIISAPATLSAAAAAAAAATTSTPHATHTAHYNHFALSSSLLTIPQQLTQGQHATAFPPAHSSSATAASATHTLPPYTATGASTDLYQDSYNVNTNQAQCKPFNFLWWYPETNFCELDNNLVRLP